MNDAEYAALTKRLMDDAVRVSKLYADTRAKKSQAAEMKEIKTKIAALEAEDVMTKNTPAKVAA